MRSGYRHRSCDDLIDLGLDGLNLVDHRAFCTQMVALTLLSLDMYVAATCSASILFPGAKPMKRNTKRNRDKTIKIAVNVFSLVIPESNCSLFNLQIIEDNCTGDSFI